MKFRIIILIAFCFLLLTCGINKTLQPELHQRGRIYDLTLTSNTLTFTTGDSTYVNMTITASDHSEYFTGWSAGDMAIKHTYHLPFTPNKTYTVKITAENNNIPSQKDTTLVYTPVVIAKSLLKVHFINVQQGDAILIETPEGNNIQIDGGYGRRGDGSAWQGGRQPLALNYLLSKSISHLDYIIETHRHVDHYGGLDDIRASASGITHGTYISTSQRHGYTSGSRLDLNSEVGFVFFNIGYPPSYTGGDVNNSSIVLKATYGDAEFLFTGDAMGPVQDWLYTQPFDLSVDVLKVAHHGADSNNTTSGQFIDRTLNQYANIAILSFGFHNEYGHPKSLNRFRGIQTYGTNAVNNPPSTSNFHFDCGTIQVLSDGKLVFVSMER